MGKGGLGDCLITCEAITTKMDFWWAKHVMASQLLPPQGLVCVLLELSHAISIFNQAISKM